MARVKCYLKECMKTEEEEVGLLFSVKNVNNPEKAVETIQKAKEYWEGSLTFWQVVGIIIKIWTG